MCVLLATCGIRCPQVFLGPEGEVEVYDVVSIQPNAPISSDLLLDQAEENLFIMTSTMVHTSSHHSPCIFHMGSVVPLQWTSPVFLGFMCFLINIIVSVFLLSYFFLLLITVAKEARGRVSATSRLPVVSLCSWSLLWLVCPGGKVSSWLAAQKCTC